MTTLRLLPPVEWPSIQIALTEGRLDMPLPKVEQGIIIVAEQDGELVGCCGAERSWNVNPMWIKQEHRGNGLALRMAEVIKAYNTEDLAEFLVTTNPHVEKLVFRLGFIPIEGQLWRRM